MHYGIINGTTTESWSAPGVEDVFVIHGVNEPEHWVVTHIHYAESGPVFRLMDGLYEPLR